VFPLAIATPVVATLAVITLVTTTQELKGKRNLLLSTLRKK
jgi:hypothetical protein